MAAIGFADDYMKIRKKRNLGLTAREKITFQFIVSFLIGTFLLYSGQPSHVFDDTDGAVPQIPAAGPCRSTRCCPGRCSFWAICRF